MANEDQTYNVIIYFKDRSESPTYTVSAATLDQMLEAFHRSIANKEWRSGGYEVEIGINTQFYRKTKLLVDWRDVRMIG